MRVGAASSGLRVPPGTPLGGYADRLDPATGTLDELRVWCVVLESGPTPLVLVVVDLVCVNTDLAAAVAAAVTARVPVPAAHVWTMATHTHSGPDVNCGPGDRTTPTQWLVAVPRAAAAAASTAYGQRRDGALALHSGTIRGVGAVRSTADAAAAVPVDLLAVSHDGHVDGVLVVLPVHPTVLPASNSLVSGDLAAAVRRCLTERLATAGRVPWVVVATGCAGDISTRSTRRAQSPAELERLAACAADQLRAIVRGSATHTVEKDAAIRAAVRHLSLPVRAEEPAPAPDPALTGSRLAERTAHTFQQGLAVAAERRARFPEGIVRLTVSAASVGSLRILGLGAEPYLSLRGLPQAPALVLGYVNGYAGYLPDADGFDRPTYESLSSPFRPDAAWVAVRTAEDLIARPDTEENT